MTLRRIALVLAVLGACAVGFALAYDGGDEGRPAPAGGPAALRPTPPAPYATAPARVRLRPRFKRPPRAALLWDVRSGRVLWSRRPYARRPVASLAKMMTALVVDERARWSERVRISRRAKAAPGSAVGLLPPRGLVRVRTLVYGLMLPSGNDAAVALAEHVAGDVPNFVALMNERARGLGLRCTSYSTPNGYVDRGNESCPRDLAVVAREVLRRPRLARVVRTARISFPALLPHTDEVGGRRTTLWRPGRLHLSSHNPLLRAGYRGTTGIKTGYTDAAGRCFVGTARRGGRHLGVVLLDSPDPGGQAQRLLDQGFRALRARAHTPGA